MLLQQITIILSKMIKIYKEGHSISLLNYLINSFHYFIISLYFSLTLSLFTSLFSISLSFSSTFSQSTTNAQIILQILSHHSGWEGGWGHSMTRRHQLESHHTYLNCTTLTQLFVFARITTPTRSTPIGSIGSSLCWC